MSERNMALTPRSAGSTEDCVNGCGSACLAPEFGSALPVACQIGGQTGEFPRVVEIGEQAVTPMHDMLVRGGVVIGNDRQAARHRLHGYVAKGLGKARKDEYVAGCVVRGEILAATHAGKNAVRMGGLQSCPLRTVTDQHQRVSGTASRIAA